jgi:methionine-R-sulfoxide reductase
MNGSKIVPIPVGAWAAFGVFFLIAVVASSWSMQANAEPGGPGDGTSVPAADTPPSANRFGKSADTIEEPPYEPKSKSELRRLLTPLQFKVTQSEGTEPAFRNKYWDNKQPGLYRCVVCGLSLFRSETKYKSGTGWPSFYQPIQPDHVGYKTDWHLLFPRKEVHCSRCNAHLGHVFNDGPRDKTGKRYCMNSAALRFEKAEAKSVDADDR